MTFHADGSISTAVVPGVDNTLGGSINVENISLTADGQDAMTLRRMNIELGSVTAKSADISQILVEDGQFTCRRMANGNLRAAGLEIAPGGSASAANPAAVTSPTAATLAGTAQPQVPFPLTLNVKQLAVKHFRAVFRDDAVAPAAEVQFNVDDLLLSGIKLDPANLDSPVGIKGRFSAPGLWGSAAVDGTCKPFAATKTVELSVRADDVRPDVLRPYLEMAGIESDLKSGRLTCQTSADVTIAANGPLVVNARLTQVKWNDGGELFALDDVRIAGLGLAPGSVHVDSVDVVGPRLAARREASGAFSAGGFRLLPRRSMAKSLAAANVPTTVSKTSSNTRPATAPAALARLPKLDIGRFTWNGVGLQLNDQFDHADTTISIEDAGVELANIHVDFDPNAPAAAPGKIRAWLKAPGLAGRVEMKGTVHQLPGGMSADLEITGEKLSARLAAPYLKAFNIEPMLTDGSLHAKAHVDLTQTDEQVHANIVAEQVRFFDGAQEAMGIDKAVISGVEYVPGLLQVDSITLEKPRAARCASRAARCGPPESA